MAGVSVEKVALQSGIQVCKTCIHELQSSSQSLKNDYQAAGAGWRDQQYARLGGIVGECCSALEKPIADLQVTQSRIEKLLQEVVAYEQVSL